ARGGKLDRSTAPPLASPASTSPPPSATAASASTVGAASSTLASLIPASLAASSVVAPSLAAPSPLAGPPSSLVEPSPGPLSITPPSPGAPLTTFHWSATLVTAASASAAASLTGSAGFEDELLHPAAAIAAAAAPVATQTKITPLSLVIDACLSRNAIINAVVVSVQSAGEVVRIHGIVGGHHLA